MCIFRLQVLQNTLTDGYANRHQANLLILFLLMKSVSEAQSLCLGGNWSNPFPHFPLSVLNTQAPFLKGFSKKKTEVLMNLIQKDFNGHSIDVIHHKKDYWLNAEQIGSALEYSNARKSINDIYNRNKELLADYTCVRKLRTQGQKRQIRVFNEEGVMLITMKSRQPKAIEFQKWAVKVLKNYRATPKLAEHECMAKLVSLQDEVLELYRWKVTQLVKPKAEKRVLTKISDEEIEEMHSLYADGKSINEIAKEIGRSSAAVRYSLIGSRATNVNVDVRLGSGVER